MEFKNELLNNMFDERWGSINIYHYLDKLTGDELILLTEKIQAMGYNKYYWDEKYIFNPQLLYMISIITKKKKIINDHYYMAIRYFVEIINETDVKRKDIDMLINVLYAMDPNEFPSFQPTKLFI